MFQMLYSDEAARRRHRNAPFADERARYLQYCADQGATRATLRLKSAELLWLAEQRVSGDRPKGASRDRSQAGVRLQGGNHRAEIDRYRSTVAAVHGLVARANR